MQNTILGIPFHVVNLEKAVAMVISFLDEDEKIPAATLQSKGLCLSNQKRTVVTPNPEIVMEAKKDKLLRKIIKTADLSVADGIGIVLASKLTKGEIRQRVAGYDLVQALFAKLKMTDKSFYFLGGGPGVAQKAAQKMIKKHTGLCVLGYHDGFFNASEEEKLIEEINALSPDILLVGLGAPKQEKWIYANKEKINAKVFVGVGGSFDVMSGKTKRAPIIFQKLAMEWFYRLIKEPKRIKRMIKLPLFLLEVIANGKQNQ